MLLSHQQPFSGSKTASFIFTEHRLRVALLDANGAVLPRNEAKLVLENFASLNDPTNLFGLGVAQFNAFGNNDELRKVNEPLETSDVIPLVLAWNKNNVIHIWIPLFGASEKSAADVISDNNANGGTEHRWVFVVLILKLKIHSRVILYKLIYFIIFY